MVKKFVIHGVFAMLMLLRVSAAEAESILTFQTILNGTNTVPANSSPAIGVAIVTVDLATNLLTLDLSWTGLVTNASGTHIHCCALPGANGTLAITFTGVPAVTSGSYSRTLDLTVLTNYSAAFRTAHGGTAEQSRADLLAGLAGGTAYAEVLSSTVPSGEIRGNLAAVPESSSLVLMSAGLCGLAWLKRRTRHRMLFRQV